MSSLQERLRALSPQKRALLARRLEGAGSETRPGIVPVERTTPDHPLSLAQERMWFLQRQAPESAAYNLGVSARGTIDPVAFRAELTAVVARHEAWRATFHLVDGAVRQRVHAPGPVELPVLAAPPGVDADAHFEETVRRLVGAPFDLAEGPLHRFALVATGEAGVYRFIGVVHHIIFDSAAVQILLGEIGHAHATLAAGGTLPPLPVQYIDYAYWERAAGAAERARQVELYRQRLTGAPGVIALATDRPRPPRPSGAGGAVPLRFDAALTAALKALGADVGATLYTVLLGAWAVLLQRHGAGDDLVIGAPVATRGRPELRGLLGLLVNTVPLRVTLAGDDGAPDFRAVLARLGEVVREALAAPEVPLGPLCDALGIERSPARHPLFQVIFDLHVTTTLPPGVPVEADSLRQHVAEGTAKFELSLILAEHPEADGATIAGRIEYSADLFDHGTVAAMASQLEALLRAVAADAARPIDRLPLMDPATRAEIIRSRGRSPFLMAPPGAYAETVVAQFAAQAAARPDAVAISMLDADGARTTLSYGALDARANQVAAALIARGAGPGEPVALCLERSPALVIGLVGVLKAGAAYLPMEPAWPWPRMRAVMRDAGVRLAVTEAELLAAFDETVEAAVVLDRQRGAARCAVIDAAALDALPATAPDRRPAPEDLAYCIYTSGSTGEPKGVQVTHHNVIRLFAASAAMYGFTADDVWSGCHAFTFDVSVFELWGALAHGAELALVPHLTTRSPRDLHRVLAASRVTMLSQTPSALAVLAPVDAEAEIPLPLRAVVLAGEAFEPRRFTGFLARYGERALVVNMYGITETTVHSTWRRITLADAAQSHSPIGAPLADTRLRLLDDHLEPVPTGAPGELWVGGDGVSLGYLERPALTAARFVDDPFDEGRLYRSGDRARYRADGELEYLGRRDAQVKIHGFRVETGEIEAALMSNDAVRDAAVGVHRDADAGGDRLVAWVVADQPLTAATLRAHLQRTLPDYMLPHAFVMLDALPLTANGKLDRRALPAPDSRRPAVAAGYLAPEGPLEAALAALWQGVLKLDRVGRHDNFFELGGDSIKGAIMIEQLQRQSGAIIPVMVLFDVQTIAGFADWLTQNTPEGAQRMAAGGGSVPGATLTAGGAITADDIDRFRALVPPFAPRRPAVRGRRVIIVLTPPRSGSTLLRVMLGGHPALFSPPELELLGFATLAERAATLSGRLKHWREGTVRALMALSALDADAAFAEMARLEAEDLDVPGFYAHLQALMGARTLVDKTASYPLDVAVMAAAERYFEDPLYIHLHRHPVDGVSSFLTARIDDMGFFRAEHPFDRAQLAELVWTVSHQNIARFLATVPAERQIRVGYEALVQDPVGQIERLCRFIGVEVAPAMLDPYTDKTARMTDGVHPDAGWMLGDIKFHHYTRIEASSARRWQKAGVDVNLGAPTWDVAEALGYRRPVERSPLLVPLAEGPAAEHAPLWCVHPVGGHVFAYRALARALGAERPVYGIRAEAFAGVDDPATTIEEMARRYLDAIRAAQPAGPYLLAGWSLGGVAAYEMAQQLTAAGEAVGALVLIDSATPGRGGAGPAALVGDDPLAWMGLDLAGLGGEELPALIEAMRRMSPAERRAHLRERIEGSEIARRLGEAQRARLVQVFRDNLAALAGYRPAPYPGEATLLRAARRVDPSRDTDGWGALVARLRVLRVPGHHYSMLQPPHVAELARLVSAALPAGAPDAR
ncbi:MAG: amino acid adenylation domain-containing protein [bacterium]